MTRRRLSILSRLPCALAAAGLLSLAGGAASAAEDGAAVFEANCSACHQPDGKGIPGAFPALAGNAFVTGDPEPSVLVVLNGRGGMPTFKADMNDEQVAAVMTYVRSSWGAKADPVKPDLVAAVRAKLTHEPPVNPLQMH
jgi:mono/diheme cytochrome c family protein